MCVFVWVWTACSAATAACAVAMQVLLLLLWNLVWAIDVCVLFLLPAASTGECFFGLLAAAAAATGRPRQDSSPQRTAPQRVLCVMLPRLCCVLPLSSNFSHTCLVALCSTGTALGAAFIHSMSLFCLAPALCGCVHLPALGGHCCPLPCSHAQCRPLQFWLGERGAPRVAQADPPVGAEPTGQQHGKSVRQVKPVRRHPNTPNCANCGVMRLFVLVLVLCVPATAWVLVVVCVLAGCV